VTGFPGHSF
jgi:hypothetical protein